MRGRVRVRHQTYPIKIKNSPETMKMLQGLGGHMIKVAEMTNLMFIK